jgi:hypothetical protein
MVGRATQEYRVIVPDDAVSIQWSTVDAEGNNLFASIGSVMDPNATSLVDLRTWNQLRDQPIRTRPSQFQFNSAQLPMRDGQRVVPGAYRSVHLLYNNPGVTMVATRRVRGNVIVKRAPGGTLGTTWQLRARIWLVGVPGLTAASAPTNPRLQAALTQVRRIYAAANVNFVTNGYVDVTGADATRYSVIDSLDELRGLFSRTTGGDFVLNLMIVRGISASAGLENAIGVAGTIGGPAGLHGTGTSGVVASWETTFGGGRDVLPITIAHECGHYLGLWHTQENLAACTTAMQMMCSAFGGVDPITDTPTGTGAMGNLMYWLASGGTTLSAGQSYVMRGHPLVF